jgi:hypothetical protein
VTHVVSKYRFVDIYSQPQPYLIRNPFIRTLRSSRTDQRAINDALYSTHYVMATKPRSMTMVDRRQASLIRPAFELSITIDH